MGRVVQFRLKSTVRNLGIAMDDALKIADHPEVLSRRVVATAALDGRRPAQERSVNGEGRLGAVLVKAGFLLKQGICFSSNALKTKIVCFRKTPLTLIS